MVKTNKAGRIRKGKRNIDVKMAQANDLSQAVAPAEAAEAPKVAVQSVAKETVVRRNDSLVQKGAKYAVLAGRPSKHAVIAVFGPRGYALSWVARAEKMNTTPEALCARFKSEPQEVKVEWELAHPIVVKAKPVVAVPTK